LRLKNVSATTNLNLNGVRFTNGIYFNFTGSAVTNLAPGQIVLLVRNQAAFTARYTNNTALIAGQFTGTLDNGVILAFPDKAAEDVGADGMYCPAAHKPDRIVAIKLDIVNELAAWELWDKKSSWRPSGVLNGSPGTDDPLSGISPILINEALTHTDLPQLDSVELYNPNASAVNIGGWFLTDDKTNPKKFRIPNGTIISAGGFAVFDQNQFDTGPNAFRFSEYGEDAYVFSGDANTNLTGYAHGYTFDAAPNGVSFGRYMDSTGDDHFVLQSTNSLGNTNNYPRVGPIVISEFMYHPPDAADGSDDDTNEFIELQNIGATNMPLYDPAATTNTWHLRNAVDFNFPTNQILAVGARLLVVGFNPTNVSILTSFRAKYNAPTNVPVFGPWSGKLDNGGETIELQYPDKPDVTNGVTYVPYIIAEKINYSDSAPWPTNADGLGSSLQRIFANGFANDPINWLAAAPTAGTNNLNSGIVDADGDGLADTWEIANGTNPFLNDTNADPDADGLNNWQEFIAGTNPNNSASVLRFENNSRAGTNLLLNFNAIANRSYTIQYRTQLNSGSWQKWLDVNFAPSNRTIWLTNIVSRTNNNFFRIATPILP